MKNLKIQLLALTVLISMPAIGMEQAPQAPQQQRVLTPQELVLWNQLKQRMGVLRELKNELAQRSQRPTLAPMPANFIPQSLIQLKGIFGEGKTEDEYMNLAIQAPKKDPGFVSPLYIDRVASFGPDFEFLAKKALNNEKKYWNYYPFYHGQKGGLALVNDIMTALYEWLNLETAGEQTKFLRLFTKNSQEYKNVDAFLEPLKSQMNVQGYFDHNKAAIKNLLSTNVALFGNTGWNAESSWYYFVASVSNQPPSHQKWGNQPSAFEVQLSEFFKSFGFNEKYIQPIMEIHREYLDQIEEKAGYGYAGPGLMQQIFIHPSVVDEIAYPTKYGGVPYFKIESLVTAPEIKQHMIPIEKQLQQDAFDPRLGRISLSKLLKSCIERVLIYY